MPKRIIKPKFVATHGSIKEIPMGLFENRDLLKIKLSHNVIRGVPKEIGNLTRLETLDLSNNRITQVFSKLFQLPKLRILNLNNNQLKNVPKQVKNLKNLRYLQVANNVLEDLPDEIGELQNLREINLSYNEFSEFPRVLFKLKNLRTIWLGGNYFEDFPAEKLLKELPELKRLYIKSNINYGFADYVDERYLKYSSVGGNNLKALKDEFDVKPKPVNDNTIFISYAHDDKKWLEKLTPYLKALQNLGIDIDPWDDRRIKTGDKWRDEISNNLKYAKAAILMVSINFMASDFIHKKELPPLLELAERRGMKIYCLILDSCPFSLHKELAAYQTANDPGSPLDGLSDHEAKKIFNELALTISKDFTSD